MRPRGEIREALASAVAQLVPEVGPVNYLQAAQAARVGFDAAQRTLENMARAGELVRAGKHKPPGSPHWHNLYELPAPDADDTPRAWGGIEALASAVDAIARTVDR